MNKNNTKKYKKKLIGRDDRYNTNWNALIALSFIAFIVGTVSYTSSQEKMLVVNVATKVEAKVERTFREVRIITTQEYEKQQAFENWRQDHLAKLRQCESFGDDGIIGDAGESVGPYQWQKPTLEDKLGRKITNKEWLMLATDYEFIHELTYEVYFEQGEWWRWLNCSNRFNYPYENNPHMK